jgi:hypothetical protein
MQSSGIYKLEFTDGTYYIGQSVNLQTRQKEHYRLLLAGKHHNFRVQDTYDKLKELPIFTTIINCDVESLNTEEDRYINIKDIKCLNIKAGGSSNFGINAVGAKYETSDIELAFLILVNNPGISHKEVSEYVGIDINTVHDISSGRNRAFTEMKVKYPAEYEKLLKIKANNTRGKFSVTIMHTDGRTVTLLSGELSKFCKQNNIQTSNLSKVINGSRKTTMGWSLVEKHENF